MLSVDMELTDEIVSVIGMSGSGKSMTLKCIAGIETPDCGFISLNWPSAVRLKKSHKSAPR